MTRYVRQADPFAPVPLIRIDTRVKVAFKQAWEGGAKACHLILIQRVFNDDKAVSFKRLT